LLHKISAALARESLVCSDERRNNRTMLLVPAWAWWGGVVHRAVCVGVPVGIFLAALVFAESGVMLGAVVAFVVISIFNGVVMARRMDRFWPAARDLSAGDRVAAVRAARRGQDIDQARLASAAIQYAGGLRKACEQARRWRWFVWLAAAAMLVLAVLDSISGPPRTAVVSWLFVVFFAVEIFWWPLARDRLLANAERTAESARRALSEQRTDDA
jgi:hypothetical protein